MHPWLMLINSITHLLCRICPAYPMLSCIKVINTKWTMCTSRYVCFGIHLSSAFHISSAYRYTPSRLLRRHLVVYTMNSLQNRPKHNICAVLKFAVYLSKKRSVHENLPAHKSRINDSGESGYIRRPKSVLFPYENPIICVPRCLLLIYSVNNYKMLLKRYYFKVHFQ